jgi:starch synthase (maltosyl-transferring)
VVTLDPFLAQDGLIHLDAEALGLPVDRPYVVRDELSGERFVWFGADPWVRLEPWSRVAHIIDLRAEDGV